VYISKSQYTRAAQCHKSSWLYKHKKELLSAPDENKQAMFDSGNDVGELAQQLFPGGELIEFDYKDFEGMLSKTADLIASGCKTIYEASFSEEGVFVMNDILHHGESGWELYEVKASTATKAYHLDDIAIQWYVLNQANISLAKAFVVHLNNGYVKNGPLDISKLFTFDDVTDQALERQDAIPDKLRTLDEVLTGDEPIIEIGNQCKTPFSCDFINHCWQGIPEQSVFNLYRLGTSKKFELFHGGVVGIDDLPDDMVSNSIQKLQVDAHRLNEPIVDKEIISDFLDRLEEPLYHLDFETFQNAIPRFDGQTSYQQIPFQYSLHIEQDGETDHIEYLADEKIDPRRELSERLLNDLDKVGSIVAFNAGFEIGVIRSLAESFPDLSDDLLALNERFVDLLKPFQQGGYYDEKMNGSFSLKAVLPAIFPDESELSYKGLSISNGQVASSIFSNLHTHQNPDTVNNIRSDLLAYCRLDTLAMVKIVGFLRDLVR
jgi:hypothetical protein